MCGRQMTEREVRMMERFQRTSNQIAEERLPGWEAFLASDPKAKAFLDQKGEMIAATYMDEDEVLHERACNAYKKACDRVNEVVAEKYREENPDAELWELRYIKWMKIVYIHFTSERGDFYLLPRRPKKKPRVEHWYTVDEMLDMLHPTTVAALALSDTMPPRPGNMKGPARGEKHLHVDFTGPEMKVHYELPKGGLNG